MSLVVRLLNSGRRWDSAARAVRNFSSRTIEDPIVVTDEGSTIVCWHPEKSFPYECTTPMPLSAPKPLQVLKMAQPMKVFKPALDQVEREELMKITYTTKHRWFPKKRSRKLKLPKDREFL
ncbi:39S ribosomal protein L42, mitochondrial [Cimex lectularius]|uniref:Large ribosomal subunit protein mL42 n=1 Tax=Cimex lectularius TaxID=79782 RepID=A0A8I6RL46_CIMLE|nr:39S ribosomal protein L42, mitochondrial [Cimex lectularius]